MKTGPWGVRRRIDAFITGRPFLLLVRHFAQRAVGASDTASTVDLGIGGALAILAIPGAFTSIGLAQKYGSFFLWISGRLAHFDPYRESIRDEYFFLMYTMAVAGFVTILRWDHLLPGRRDFANLAPLPLALRSIFLSNAAALAIAAVVFAVDVNGFSGFFFPLLIAMHGNSLMEYAGLCFAHWSAVMGLSLFTMIAILALQGFLMALLPDAVYRRVSLAVRFVMLTFFFALLVSAFVFPLSAVNFRFGSKAVGAWWPPVWFLSLYEWLIPQLRHGAAFGARAATVALAAAILVTAVSFTLSYRRYFLRIAERPEGASQPSRAGLIRMNWFHPVLRIGLANRAEIATFQFVVKTILRSETHLLFAGLWTGIGLLLSLEGIMGAQTAIHGSGKFVGAILAAPLIFSFGLMAGLRFVFDIPAAIDANWLFRLAATEGAIRVERVSRTVMLFFAIPPIVLIWFPLAVRGGGAWTAGVGLMCDLALLQIGTNMLLLSYRKIPCTCSFLAHRDRVLRLALTCLATLAIVIPILVSMEGTIIAHPMRLLIYGPLLAGTAAILEVASRRGLPQLVFEDAGVEPFALLRLAGD